MPKTWGRWEGFLNAAPTSAQRLGSVHGALHDPTDVGDKEAVDVVEPRMAYDHVASAGKSKKSRTRPAKRRTTGAPLARKTSQDWERDGSSSGSVDKTPA